MRLIPDFEHLFISCYTALVTFCGSTQIKNTKRKSTNIKTKKNPHETWYAAKIIIEFKAMTIQNFKTFLLALMRIYMLDMVIW
jgi:hypothetical protein